jgi:uncharacterized protein (DUF934 family)
MSERQIIRHGAVVRDDWSVAPRPGKGEAVTLPSASMTIVPLEAWQAERNALIARGEPLGVWIDGDQDPLTLGDDVHLFSVVAVNFATFKDGRGYSSAVLLRERLGYRGELRAIGDVLRDQLFYLKRVGFDSFAVRADKKIDDALRGLTDFSESYQGSVDQPSPLFRRRAAAAAATIGGDMHV